MNHEEAVSRRGRAWLCIVLILGSPLVAAAVMAAVYAVMDRLGLNAGNATLNMVVFFVNAAVGAAGSARGLDAGPGAWPRRPGGGRPVGLCRRGGGLLVRGVHHGRADAVLEGGRENRDAVDG